MLAQLPKERMPQIWSLSDASLVLLRKLPLFETVIPSKIFESMAMGRPIILGVGGEARAIVEESQSGLVIDPESSTNLCTAVLKLAHNPSLGRALGANGQRHVAAHFDRRVLARRFEGVLSALHAHAAHERPQSAPVAAESKSASLV